MDRTRWLTDLYAGLTCLYPPTYREEYREELRWVIHQAATDASQQGNLALLRLAWRELHDLPGALLREHRREREKIAMQLKPGSNGGEGRQVWKQLATCGPFMILAIFLTLAFLPAALLAPTWVSMAFLVLVLGFLLGLLLAGLVKGFPRWSLPTLGLALFIATYAVDGGTGRLFSWFGLVYTRSPYTLSEKLTAVVVQANLYFLPSLLVILGLVVASLWRSTSWPFSRLVRRDWSALSLIMYGWSLPQVIFYDFYNPEIQPYELVAVLILALGVWAYLKQPTPARGWLALAAAVALQAIVLGGGIYHVYPLQPISDPSLVDRLWEAAQPLLVATFTIVWMTVPVLLSLLPRPRELVAG